MTTSLVRALAPFVLAVATAASARAADVSLAWDDSDPSVIGYRLYTGAYSGVYTQTLEVGTATSTSLTNCFGLQQPDSQRECTPDVHLAVCVERQVASNRGP